MFETPYYHETLKKVVIAFGALFSEIKVIRKNLDGTVGEIVQVPIAYSPKEKTLRKVDEDPVLAETFFSTLPRMGFEIVGYSFAAGDMTNKNNIIKCLGPDGLSYAYTPVPYNVQIQLNILSKGTEDSLAIIEQILPIFSPEYNLNVRVSEALNLNFNFPLILNSVSTTDDYEGDMKSRRLVINTLDFTMKVKFLGQVHTGGNGVIYHTNANLYNQIPTPSNPFIAAPAEYRAEGNPTTFEITETGTGSTGDQLGWTHPEE